MLIRLIRVGEKNGGRFSCAPVGYRTQRVLLAVYIGREQGRPLSITTQPDALALRGIIIGEINVV